MQTPWPAGCYILPVCPPPFRSEARVPGFLATFNMIQRKFSNWKRKRQAGMTAIDTIVSLGIFLVVAAGVIELFAMASATGTQHPSAARTAEFARVKMEQLLEFCSGADTEQAGATKKIGSTLAGCTDRNTSARTPSLGGSLDTKRPAAHYVDYLDANGNAISPTAQWQYIRVWEISVPSGAAVGIKQIAVKAQARLAAANGVIPEFTIVTTRSFASR